MDQVCEQLNGCYGDDHDVQALYSWLLYHKGELIEAEKRLRKVTANSGNDAKHYYWLARVLYCKLSDDKSFKSMYITTMLQAAKLDPYHSNTFLYLGHYYGTVVHDDEKARRCYQKAYDLDPENEDAGVSLVDMLSATGNNEKAHEILLHVTSVAAAGSAKWAWLRLGLHQLHHESEPSQAITSLQCALRADPHDGNCWECLAEGYMARGSYTAALKAFTRASELTDDNIYSLYQIATIKHTLYEYTEAVQDYEGILQKRPHYVPALTGMGMTYLALARSSLSQFFHGRAVDCCQKALDHLTRAASQRADLSCVWKLIGDACCVLHNLDANLVRMTVPTKLLTADQKVSEECILGKMDILALGTRCYGRCLKLSPAGSGNWHDLGLSYHYQSESSNDDVMEQKLNSSAVKAVKQAITLEPNNHTYWNTLGVISLSKMNNNAALAQHCFIKSSQLEPNNAMAWTNLGVLYLKHDNIKLAHEAFKMAQSLEPTYVTSWIGQAMIAETVGHEEAMDLFRHTTELANHVEGSIGYGHWVCQTMRSYRNRKTDYYRYAIEQMSAVPMACDALARYTDRRQGDSTAWNLYGLLLERQGLHSEAVRAFTRAIQVVDMSDQPSANKVKSNLARALCRNDQCSASVDMYQSLLPLTEFEDICGLALAQYKLGNLKESYQAYEQASELAPSETDRSHVHTAMAMVLYTFRDLDGAKSSLFKASQMAAPSPAGLLALCCLGLIQGDLTLAAAVMAEVHKLGDASGHITDVTHIDSLFHYLQGNLVQSRNQICKAIHRHPDDGALWCEVAKNLQITKVDGNVAAPVCCKKAVCLNHKLEELPQITAVSAMDAGLMSPGHRSGSDAFSAAKKAVHLFPDKVQNWCVLLATAQAVELTRKLQSCSPHLATVNTVSLSSHLLNRVEALLDQNNVESSQLLHKWCAKQYVVSLLSSGRHNEALQFLTMAAKVFPSDNDRMLSLTGLLSFVQNNVVEMKTLLNLHDLSSIMLLVDLMIKQGDVMEVVTLLHSCLAGANSLSSSEKQRLLLHLAYVALLLFKEEKDKKWEKLCSDALRQLQDLDPVYSTTFFLQGALAYLQSNDRVLRRSFEKLLKCPPEGSVFRWQRHIARKVLHPIYQEKGDTESLTELIGNATTENDEEFLRAVLKQAT